MEAQVRLLIRDDGSVLPQEFLDADLTVFLALTGNNVFLAAAMALKAWAAKLSNYIPNYKLTDGKSVDRRAMAEQKMKLAENYESKADLDGDATAVADAPYLVDDAGQDFTDILDPDDVLPSP